MAAPNYQPLFQVAGKLYDVDPLLLQAIQSHEDPSGDPNAVGPPNKTGELAQGVMQFLPSTAKAYGVDVNSPVSSINGAARYLADLRQQTNDNLPQMLAVYGGGNATGYASSVLDTYHALQAQQRGPQKTAQQVSDTDAPAGVRNASFPPPNAPTVFTAEQGNAGQPAPSVRTTASSSDITLSAPSSFNPPAGGSAPAQAATPPQAQQGNAPAPAPAEEPQSQDDFAKSFFAPSTGAAAAPAVPPQAAQSQEDFTKSFFAPPAQAPAPARPPAARPSRGTLSLSPTPQPAPTAQAGAPASTAPVPPSAAPQQPQPAAAPPPPANRPPVPAQAQAPSPAVPPAGTPQPQSAPDWWTRNITAPLAAMDNPLTANQPPDNYLLNVPLLQSIGAGVGQGFRDIGETANAASRYLDQRIPVMAAIDRAVGFDPNAPDPLTAERQAYEKQHAGDTAADVARLASNIAFSAPLLEAPIGLAGRAAEAVPGAINAAGKLTRGGALLKGGAMGATAGGVGNALTSAGYNEDPTTALTVGALGGGALGVGLGAIGNKFLRPTERVAAERTELADKLDVPLSVGDRLGGAWKRIEDTNSIFPGSGSALKNQIQRQAIARLLNGEMGQGAGDWIDYRTLAQATQDIGNRIDNAASRISIIAPPGNPAFTRTLNQIETAANQMSPTQGAPAARGLINEIQNIQAHNGGAIPGADFQRLLQRGSLLDDAVTSADPEIRRVGIRVKSALLDAAQASPTANQADLQAFQQGRYQWKVLKTIDSAIEKTVGGTDEMSMPALARDIRGEFDMLKDQPMPNLARLIDTTKGLASSGTSERAAWQKLLGLSGETAGPPGLLWALNYPHAAEQAIPYAALGTGLNYLTARLGRFGPSLGYGWLSNLQRAYNPLLPRVAGPYAGRIVTGQPLPGEQPR